LSLGRELEASPPMQIQANNTHKKQKASARAVKTSTALTKLVREIKQMKMSSPKKTGKAPKRRVNGNQLTRMRRNMGVVQAAPYNNVYNTSTQAERVRGSDYITSVTFGTNNIPVPGQIVQSIVVTPNMTVRLDRTTSRFQRVKWYRSMFRINGDYSSLAGGSYAAAFVRDPTDVPLAGGPDQVLRWVMAQQHACIAKWWEPMNIEMPTCPDLLWTSVDKEPRFYSPGQLVIVCVTSPAQPGAVTLWFDWDVGVTEPSIENEDEESEPTYSMTRDARLTWYPFNASYALLVQTFAPDTFAPDVHYTFPPIDMEAWGLGEIHVGQFVYSNNPVQFLAQYNTVITQPKPESFVSTNLWKCGLFTNDQTTTTFKALTPYVRFLKTDGSGYDVEPVAYVNSTGSGAYTWADIYGSIVVLPAGTEFRVIDPYSHYVAEEITIFRKGVKHTMRTGRTRKAVGPLTETQRLNLIPMVSVPIQTTSLAPQQVEVVNTASQPVPVSLTYPANVTVVNSADQRIPTYSTGVDQVFVVNNSSNAIPVNTIDPIPVYVEGAVTVQATDPLPVSFAGPLQVDQPLAVEVLSSVPLQVVTSTPLDVNVTNSQISTNIANVTTTKTLNTNIVEEPKYAQQAALHVIVDSVSVPVTATVSNTPLPVKLSAVDPAVTVPITGSVTGTIASQATIVGVKPGVDFPIYPVGQALDVNVVDQPIPPGAVIVGRTGKIHPAPGADLTYKEFLALTDEDDGARLYQFTVPGGFDGNINETSNYAPGVVGYDVAFNTARPDGEATRLFTHNT